MPLIKPIINSFMSQPICKHSIPASATHPLVALTGITTLVACLIWLKLENPLDSHVIYSSLLLMLAPFTCMAILDLFWQKVYLRPSSGLSISEFRPSIQRVITKYLGLLGTVGFLSLIYWLFPEYRGAFYKDFYALAKLLLPIWLILALPYFYWIDGKMIEPHDGYWHVGQFLRGQLKTVEYKKLIQHTLGWIIKGYFFPLMFTYTCMNLGEFFRTEYNITNFQKFYDFCYFVFFFIDVVLASMGYLISMRLLDNHIRSSEPTMLGWSVALLCYEPFWSMVGSNYLKYHNDISWGKWLYDTPTLYTLWGSFILICLSIYIWATVMFGTRFSNLTHRGILTNGPYRWTKHPAYISKNISWWLISVPFLAEKSWDENLRHCVLLLLVNLVYFARAKTEERHLSLDPTYVTYANWISEYGVIARIKKLFKSGT